MKTIGVIVPTSWEAHDILHRIVFHRLEDKLFETDLQGTRILLHVSGVGREAASEASNKLVLLGAKELVSMGFCGALLPSLKVGDLVTDRIVTVNTPAKTPAER